MLPYHAYMDIRQLRYFVQIGNSGSLSRAAEICRISQPSLSLQIKNLEEGLGVQLLLRHARGVTLTEHGRLLYQHADHILKEVNRAHDALQSSTTQLVGSVSVGIPTSACRGLAPYFIANAKRELPEVSIRIVEAMTAGLDEWIQSGKLDVALLYNQKAFVNVAWTELMVEDLLLIVPPCSNMAKLESISFRQLKDIPLVLPGQPNALRIVIDSLCARLDVDLTVAIDCDSLPAITQLVRNGYNTIMPHFAVSEEVGAHNLKAIRIVAPVPSWRLSVVLSKRTLNLRTSEAVAELMAKTIRDMMRTGLWQGRTLVKSALT